MSNAGVLPNRVIIRLGGADRVSFLQGLITQDVENLRKGESAFSALLTPQGKILFDFFVVNAGDQFLIDCFRDAAPMLLKRLTLYKLRADVAMAIDEDLLVAVSDGEIEGAVAAYRDPRLAALGWRDIARNGERPVAAGYDAMRIALGVPQFGDDFGGDEAFLLDVNYDALNAVSYKKGCFVGQEVASRMKRKGDVRRRTLVARFDGAALEKGESVTAGASRLGEILSSAPEAALARIRLDRWERARADGATPTCAGREMRLVVPEYLEQR